MADMPDEVHQDSGDGSIVFVLIPIQQLLHVSQLLHSSCLELKEDLGFDTNERFCFEVVLHLDKTKQMSALYHFNVQGL